MPKRHLLKIATIEQTCAWLQAHTDENWELPRLIEHGLMPWFWLDYEPGSPEIFGERHEGYLAPLCFARDPHRLECDGSDVLITMTRTHDGKLFGIANGGLRTSLGNLRFKREDIERLADKITAGNSNQENTKGEPASNQTRKKNARWTDEELRDLLNERQSGKTRDELAPQYGLSSQRISVLIKRARKKFEIKNAADLSPAGQVRKVAFNTRPIKS